MRLVQLDKIYVGDGFHLGGGHIFNRYDGDVNYYVIYLDCINYEIVDGKIEIDLDKCIKDTIERYKFNNFAIDTCEIIYLLCISYEIFLWIGDELKIGKLFEEKYFKQYVKSYTVKEWIIKGLLE